MMCLTSVIIPVRNGANYLADAVASALAQLDAADEIIVVWDPSTDGTEAVAEALTDPRVRVIKGPNRGVSAARNAGLASAGGEFIAFLDHDDLWPPLRQIALLKALREDAGLGAIFGRMRIHLEPDGIPWQWILDMDGRHVPGINLGTALFRGSELRKVDGFDECLSFGEDFDYFDRLRDSGVRVGLCDVDGLIYRRHATNCTNNQRAVQNSIFDVIRRKRSRVHDRESQPGGRS
jgi:glycosyltransferase involved in cell wall biosynthesis